MNTKIYQVENVTITVADHAGFCFGVKAALNKTYETIDLYQGSDTRVFTYGPLIHNPSVIQDLSRRHVEICNDAMELSSSDAVIIRSHGVGKQIEMDMRDRSSNVIDATCPYVKKIHRIVEEKYHAGYQIVIIGDSGHPEVIGINGWCDNTAIIADCRERILDLVESHGRCLEGSVFIVAQTTIRQKVWEQCLEEIKKYNCHIEFVNTICNATEKRQRACETLAAESDMMIVIGGKNSSNTLKLMDISSKICPKTFFVENIEDLPLKHIKKCNRIGIAAGASTPERIIKEVIASMSEVITNNVEEEEMNSMQDFMAEIDKSLRLPGRNEIVTGNVILVSDREVVVNLGCKKDGIIPKDEIVLEPDQDLKSMFKEGDSVQAKVLKTDDGDGNILLSKKKLEVNEHWHEIIGALEDKSFVNAKVVKEVKGGVIAVYKEVSGFIPMSQLNDKYIEKADEFIGKTLPVRVTRVDQKRNKAVFSHKAYLVEEKTKKITEIWAGLNVGDTVDGTVMRFTDYGAFVDIGGIDGLLHISEISWGKLKHPQEVLSIGQKVSVKILSMNEEKGKISLGLKQNTPEPWSVINKNYTIGQVVEGKVVQIKEYGAFIELEPGLDGLVHISEIAFKRVTNIANELEVGQTVSAKILEIDEEKRRISLSIKETLDASAENAEEAPVAEEEQNQAPEEPVEEVEIETENTAE